MQLADSIYILCVIIISSEQYHSLDMLFLQGKACKFSNPHKI